MKNIVFWPWAMVGLLFCLGCSSIKELSEGSKVSAEVVQYGLFNGISPETKDEEGNIIHCESSAVTNLGDQLIISNDKSNPNKEESSIFSIKNNKELPSTIENPLFIQSKVLNNAKKIEAFAYSESTDLHFFSTAFDRLKSDNSWDFYNMLGYWEGTAIDQARILYRTEDEGVVSSKNLREILHRAIRSSKYPNGVSYFKVEGLAVLPNNTLLFGIREMGPSYQDFDYKFLILSTTFLKTRDGVVVNPDWKKVYEFDPTSYPGIDKPLGLSSMEYHAASNSLAILTSYEEEGKPHQTYLWMLPIQKRLSLRSKPILVTDESGAPLVFPYKGEGLTFLDKNTFFIVFDEDRVLGELPTKDGIKKRKPHQGIYALVTIKTK